MFSTATDEEYKFTTTVRSFSKERNTKGKQVATEESEARDAMDNMETLKTEGDIEEDLITKMQLHSLSDEEKLSELQSLIVVQRKTINALSKMNNELTQAVKFIFSCVN